MTRNVLLIAGGLVAIAVVLFGLIQLVPTGVSYTNPPVVSEPNWDSPQTRALAQRACFDCHSNETTWPWYSRVAPVSWLVAHDVVAGRARLNFSTWGQPSQGGRGERIDTQRLVRVVQNGSMPPSIYLPPHPEASLTAAEQQQLVQGFLATFK
jgi:Haem-binding domain